MSERLEHNLTTKFLACFVIFLTVVLMCPNPVQAVAPANIITYQGRLLNDDGVPVANTSLNIEFRFYNNLTDGTCLWSNSSATCADSVARAVNLTDGLFTENLGDTVATYATITDSTFTDNNGVYLEVEIEGEILTPRKRITAAAYAINSQSLDGLDSADFLQVDNNLFDLANAATARTNLGLGDIATLDDDSFLSSTGDTGTGTYDFSGAVFSGASPLIFEGSSADDFETTFVVTDPTVSDKTVTFQNASGTVAYLTDALLVANNLNDLNNAATARQNLDLEVGVDVQAYDTGLADMAGLSVVDGNFIVGNGTNWIVESGATARTSLGLGDIATLDDDLFLKVANNLFDLANVATARTNLGLGALAILGSVDISDNTNLIAGTNITLDGDTLNVDASLTGINSISNTGAPLALSTTDANNITLTPGTAAYLVNILSGNLKVGNGVPTIAQDGEDAYIEGTLEVDGTTDLDGNLSVADTDITFDGTSTTLTTTGAFTLTPGGAVILGDGEDTLYLNSSDWDISVAGAMTNIDSMSNTGAALAFSTTDANNITLTPGAAANLVNVLTGNLQVGNGTPSTTLDGEDAYIEGTLEVGGTTTWSSGATFNSDVDYSFTTTTANSENLTITQTHATDTSLSTIDLTFTDTAGGNTGDNYLLKLTNADDSGNVGTPDALIYLNQADTSEAIADGIFFNVAGGGLTDAVDASDDQIINALNVGANDIVGTTGLITYSESTTFSTTNEGLNFIAHDNNTNGGGTIYLEADDSFEITSLSSNVNINTIDTEGTGIYLDVYDVDHNATGLVNINFGSGNMTVTGSGASADFILDADLFSIDGTGTSNISVTGAINEDLTISQNGIADASLILSSTGTGADALQISASAGGMDISSTTSTDDEDIDISTTGAEFGDIDLTSGDDINFSATDVLTINSDFFDVDAIGEIITADDLHVNGDNIDADGDFTIAGYSGLNLTATTGDLDITASGAANGIFFDAGAVDKTANAVSIDTDVNSASVAGLSIDLDVATALSDGEIAKGIYIDVNGFDGDHAGSSLRGIDINGNTTSTGTVTGVYLSGSWDQGLAIQSATVDITTVDSGDNLTLGAAGSGDVIIQTDVDSNLTLDGGGAGVDSLILTDGDILVSEGNIDITGILNITKSSATTEVVDLTVTAASNDAQENNFTLENDGNLDKVAALDLEVTTTETGDNDELYGLQVNLTNSAVASVIETAITISGDWENAISSGSGEFVVSGGTGSVTIDDAMGNAGQLSVEGSVLDINSLTFVGAGEIASSANSDITFSPNGSGDNVFNLDGDSPVLFNISGSTLPDALLKLSYPESTTVATGTTTKGLWIDLSSNVSLAGTSNQTGISLNMTNGGGGTTTGIAFTGSPDTEIDLSNRETISNTSNGTIKFGGAGGTNNTSLYLDLDGATTNVPTFYSGNNDLINIFDGLSIGVNGDTTDSMADTDFSLSGGNDLYVADTLGIKANAYFDGILKINQDSNISSIVLDSEATTSDIFTIDATELTTNHALEITVDHSLDSGLGSGAAYYVDYETGSGNQQVDTMFAVESDCLAGSWGCAAYGDNNIVMQINSDGVYYTKGGFSGDGDVDIYIDPTDDAAHNGFIDLSVQTNIAAGTFIDGRFGASSTVTGTLNGINLDLKTNVSLDEASVTNGLVLHLPDITSETIDTTNITGISMTDVGALTQKTAIGTVNWKGLSLTTPNITQTTGTVSAAGIQVNTGTIITGGDQIGVNINAQGVGAGNLYGLKISGITGGAGTEQAIVIGDGWNDAINVNSGAFIVETTGATDIDTSLTIDAPVYVDSGYVQRLCSSSGGGNGAELTDVMIVDCINVGQADFAEMYPIAPGITYGDIVVPGIVEVTTEKGDKIVQMIKSTSAYQNIFGGIVVNNYEDGSSAGYNIADVDNPMPVSLVGRVPVNVTNEGGSISVGDPITTSSTAGYGMKATEPGMIIGYALDNFSAASGQVMVFVHSGWYAGNILTTDGSATLFSDTLILNSLETASVETPSIASQIFTLRGSSWNGSSAEVLDMKIQTQVDDSDNYRLSIKNTIDSEVAYVTNEGTLTLAGDMIVTGKIYPSDRGVVQNSRYIYYDGSAGSGGDMMRTNASGWSTGSYDFAEMFPSSEVLEAGDIVVFTGDNENIGRTDEANNTKIAGIISTRPGFLAGENLNGHFPVALAGRVPTKVNLENGSIAVGDPITTSSTMGYAMKATQSGVIVGYALEPYIGTETDSKITVFVNVGYFDGQKTETVPGINNSASLLATGSSANFTSLNLEGGLYMGGNDILNIRRLAGLSERWSIEEDGTIKTESTIKTIINSYQNEKVETTAVTSSGGVFVTLIGTAELQNGEAIVVFENIDPSFNDITSTTAPIRVIITPSGPVSLYVSEKNNNGFMIKQIGDSDSNISVDWFVTAYRKDFEPKEKEITEPIFEEPTEPTEIVIDSEITEESEVTEPTTIVEETIEEVVDVPAASPIEIFDPTVENDGGTEPEPSSTEQVSIDSSAQTGE